MHPYIRHMHINDHRFSGDEHLVPGVGKTDWMEYNRLVTKYIPDVSVLCEVSGLDAATRSLQYLKERKLYPFS